MGLRLGQSLAVLASVFAASMAGGQLPPTLTPLRPLDPAVADADPLSMSLRDTQTDLRRPTGFQHVYRVPGRDDRYMRISGGIYAMFPQSMYAPTRHGPAPLIPAGTIFFVGPPAWMQPYALMQSEEPPPNPLRIQTRVEARVDDEALNANPGVTPPPRSGEARNSAVASESAGPRIISDAEYRSQRIASLLAHAASANRRAAD